MGFWASHLPQAYLKKSAPGETDVSMLSTSGSCCGESVGPPARTGTAHTIRQARSSPSRRPAEGIGFRVIEVPFLG